MAAPAITTVTFDKAKYAPGQTITATVGYSAAALPVKLTATLVTTFAEDGTATSTVALTDSGGRVWTKKSDTGSVAVFTAQA